MRPVFSRLIRSNEGNETAVIYSVRGHRLAAIDPRVRLAVNS